MITTTQEQTPQDFDSTDASAPPRWRLHVVVSPDGALAGTAVVLGDGSTQLGRDGGVAIDDPLLSRHHADLHLRDGQLVLADAGSRNGSFVDRRRVEAAVLGHGSVLRLGHTVAVVEADRQRAPAFAAATAEIPGTSECARMLRSELDLAARAGLPVLLIGATGVGKEYAASELHRRLRRSGPIVRLNVAAIPDNLFESELFGHVAGAFTGAASARSGRMREAHRGTLVLDEIGELPAPVQAKLLRALEEGCVRPVGANADVAVDVCFVGSTNADLDAMAAAGRFRRDLLARLRGSVVHLPELRQRRPDLLALADAVAPLRQRRWRDRLHAEAAQQLLLHDWPENLRGLRAVLTRADVLAGAERVRSSHLPPALVGGGFGDVEVAVAAPPMPSRERPSAAQLQAWLVAFDGNIGAVARHVGRHRRQVYRWLAYAGLPSDRRDPGEVEGDKLAARE